MRNMEYIRQFAIKHRFTGDCMVSRRQGGDEYITGIMLSKDDCPVDRFITMDDIVFDIVSSLPDECFHQWMEYRRDVDDISFKQWIASGNLYKPEMKEVPLAGLKEELLGYINAVANDLDERWGLIDDSDIDDSDWDEDEEWDDQ